MRFESQAWRTSRAALALLVWAGLAGGAEFAIAPQVQEALGCISADSLRGNVSFLASDLLEGRATPSPGLDVAGEYIAAQFRRAGLEPAGGDGYFQTAEFATVQASGKGLMLEIQIGGQKYAVAPENIETGGLMEGVELSKAPLVKAKLNAGPDLAKWETEQTRGKALITDLPGLEVEERQALLPGAPAVVIVVTSRGRRTDPQPPLIDPDDAGAARRLPIVWVNDPAVRKAYRTMRAGDPGATVTLKVPPPVRRPVRLRNVAGLLRGSDPRLGRTYIIVSAHYDHVGICSSGADRICNGANDDASGVASVIEIASALSKMRERPKRSFLFLTYFGEERGLFGSRYYCRHPLVPLKDTVANVNLEHLGRTDDTQGDRTGRATLTGFEYSDISTTFARAGELTGVRVAKAADGDAYFARSDNQALADAGVPAHTLLVAFDFPDYHRPGDEWRKLDYANLEKVDRMIAAGLLMIAANPEPPKWNESSVQAERYLKAWRERKGS